MLSRQVSTNRSKQRWATLLEPPPKLLHDDDSTKWSALLAVLMGCGLPLMLGVWGNRWSAGRTVVYLGLVGLFLTLLLMPKRRSLAIHNLRQHVGLYLALLGLLGFILQSISGDPFVQPIVFMVALSFAVAVLPPLYATAVAAGYLGLIVLGLLVAGAPLNSSLLWTITGHTALMGFIFAFSRASVQQIVARRQADELALALAHERDQLQQLVQENARLHEQARLSATLAERNRLARDLHDTIAQGLTAITMQLEAAERSWERDAVRSRARVQRAQELSRATLQDVRRSVWDLASPLLDGATLPDALRQQVADWAAQTGIEAGYTHHGAQPTLPSAAAMQVVRIVGEALKNIEKHAGATEVQVTAETCPGKVVVMVHDNGVGFDPHQVTQANGSGFGLRSLQERANLAHGTVAIQSAPGAGTQITLVVIDEG